MTDRKPPIAMSTDERAWLDSLGLKRLSPAWAKIEIVVGLSCATCGLRFLTGDGVAAWLGGLLCILGSYLAMAGHRSHLYQAMNRQNARLATLIHDLDSSRRNLP